MRLVWALIPLVLIGIVGVQESFAEEKTWWLGENLQKEDYFSYVLCHIDYNECAPFQIEFWIEKKIEWNDETRWLAQVVVLDYDQREVITGDAEFGTLAAEPISWSPELKYYVGALKESISWLSDYAFETHPKSLYSESNEVKWYGISHGKPILQVSGSEEIKVGSRTFDAKIVKWNEDGIENKFWVANEFPFPIKADVKLCGVDNIIYQEFKFELLEHRKNISDHPFLKITHPIKSTNYLGNYIVVQDESCPEGMTYEEHKETKSLSPYLKSPRFQTNEGVEPDEVVCRFGLELIFKTTDGSAACVKPTTAVKLIQRGWTST